MNNFFNSRNGGCLSKNCEWQNNYTGNAVASGIYDTQRFGEIRAVVSEAVPCCLLASSNFFRFFLMLSLTDLGITFAPGRGQSHSSIDPIVFTFL